MDTLCLKDVLSSTTALFSGFTLLFCTRKLWFDGNKEWMNVCCCRVVVVVVVGCKKMFDELPDLAFGWSVRFWHGLTARPIGQRKNLESKMSKHYLGARQHDHKRGHSKLRAHPLGISILDGQGNESIHVIQFTHPSD